MAIELLQLLALLLLTGSAAYAQDVFDPLKYVDPLIGSLNGGNVFSGATVPYGMAKPVADTNSPSRQGGFVSDNSPVTGFSSMHDSGTGGSPSLGNFALFPYAACPGDDINLCVYPKKSRMVAYDNTSVIATPGYFSIRIANNITVDMTATHHTSLFRFNFPPSATSGSPLILLDLTDLSDSRHDNGTVTVDESTGRMAGGARFIPSFGQGSYYAYFCADFQGSPVRDNGIFANSRASTDVKDLTISRSINGYPLPGGGFVRFSPQYGGQILARVGLSFISADQACSNAESEIPDFAFDKVKLAAEMAWREKLSTIVVDSTGANSSLITMFYSSIYRTMINPQDYTGENPLWQSTEPYFDSLYCLWDSFRSQIPFLTIVDPATVSRIVRSLIDTYVHEGWMPDCRMSLSQGYTQGGSNADVILADALIKGISDSIDWDLGYQAAIKDAEVEPFDWCCHGRGGLDSWKALGYIPVQDVDYKGFGTMTRSISRTLEYSYNDFVIATMAQRLGLAADAAKYLGRSASWQNLFRADAASLLPNGTDTGFRGFFQPRHLNGTWGYQDPLYCSQLDTSGTSECSLQNTAGETFESSIWEYGFFAPHDQGALQRLYGGAHNFVRRLNFLHDQGVGDIGNEPSFLTVFQYHYAGRPGLSARRSRFYLGSAFTPGLDGLPGNDDSGAMGSFVAFNMLGLFPNPGQDVYMIVPPPYFRAAAVRSPVTGKVARVRVENFDPALNAANAFIQNATLDGADYRKNYLTHAFFLAGGELVLRVGASESGWGTRVEDRPPSVGDYPAEPSATALGSDLGGERAPHRDGSRRPPGRGTVSKTDVCNAHMSGLMGALFSFSSLVLP